MADATKLEKIKQYNQQQQAKAALANQQQNPPKLVPAAGMSTADIALIQKAADPNQTLSQDEQIKLKALETKENLKIAQEEADLQKKQADLQARKEAKLHERVLLETQRGISAAGNPIAPAANWFANLPTPAGLATIVILLVVFVLAIVPVDSNGTTRLKLVWLTITGKTHLRYQENQQGQGNSGTPPPIISPGQQAGQSQRIPIEGQVPLSQQPPPMQNLSGIDLFGTLGL